LEHDLGECSIAELETALGALANQWGVGPRERRGARSQDKTGDNADYKDQAPSHLC